MPLYVKELPSNCKTIPGFPNYAASDDGQIWSNMPYKRSKVSRGWFILTGNIATTGYRLTEPQVREIRKRRAEGERRRLIAQAFGITERAVKAITTRQRWKHVT